MCSLLLTKAIGNFLAITPPALILLLLSDFSWNTFYKEEDIITSLLFVFILASMGTALAKVMFNEFSYLVLGITFS